jgi:hypothetical protein
VGDLEGGLAEPPPRTRQEVADQVVHAHLQELVDDEGENDGRDRQQDRPTEIDVGQILQKGHPGIVPRSVRLSNASVARTHRF